VSAVEEALRASIVAHWQTHGRTPHLLISFHGIPERYCRQGDPYYKRCHTTARLLADELLLQEREWSVSFQSRFGAAEWLKPATMAVLSAMPARAVREITVVCPGFAVDCLETLEEIALENRDTFLRAGGQRFEYVPALNAGAAHARHAATRFLGRHHFALEPTHRRRAGRGWVREAPGAAAFIALATGGADRRIAVGDGRAGVIAARTIVAGLAEAGGYA